MPFFIYIFLEIMRLSVKNKTVIFLSAPSAVAALGADKKNS